MAQVKATRLGVGMKKYLNTVMATNRKILGSGCGSVGRAFFSDTRGLQFKSIPRQTFI